MNCKRTHQCKQLLLHLEQRLELLLGHGFIEDGAGSSKANVNECQGSMRGRARALTLWLPCTCLQTA